MENFKISRDFLNNIMNRESLFHSKDKKFYLNPDNQDELLVVFSSPLEACWVREKINYLFSKNKKGNDNLKGAIFPKEVLYDYKGLLVYTVDYVKDARSFAFVNYAMSKSKNEKLLLLKQADEIVQAIHELGITICDLNLGNLLLAADQNVYITDLLGGKFGGIGATCLDTSLESFYQRDPNDMEMTRFEEIDNVNMHINLLRMIDPYSDDLILKDEDDYNRGIKRMHLPTKVEETLIRMKRYDKISSIPPVTKTINQLL